MTKNANKTTCFVAFGLGLNCGNMVGKETSREGATNTRPALDIRTWKGGPTMPVDRHYTDSTPVDNPEQKETWQALGDIARKAVEKIGGDA